MCSLEIITSQTEVPSPFFVSPGGRWLLKCTFLKHTGSSEMCPSNKIIIIVHALQLGNLSPRERWVTCSESRQKVTEVGPWPQTVWLLLCTATLLPEGGEASALLSSQLPWGEPKKDIFSYRSQKATSLLYYWCILIAAKINQQPQHYPLWNFHHNTNTYMNPMYANVFNSNLYASDLSLTS